MDYEGGFSHFSSQEQEMLFRPVRSELKESESALLYKDANGKESYWGEILNRNGVSAKFDYDPNIGLEVILNNRSLILEPEDLICLPQKHGYVTIRELFGTESRRMNDVEWYSVLQERYRLEQGRIHKVEVLAEAALGRNFDMKESYYTEYETARNEAYRKQRQYTPEEIMVEYLKRVDIACQNSGVTPISKAIDQVGILSSDPIEAKRAIVDYFYLYCKLKGIDASSVESMAQALDNFPFWNELIAEYKSNPDIRFGDVLLEACEHSLQATNNQNAAFGQSVR